MKEFTFEWMIEKYGLFFRKFGLTPDILRENQNHTKTFDYAWEILHIIMGANYYAYRAHKITLEQDRIIDLEIQKIRISMLKEKGHNVKLFQIQYLLDELKFIVRTYGDELKGLELFSSGCCEYCDKYINKLLTPKEVLSFVVYINHNCKRQHYCNIEILPIVSNEVNHAVSHWVITGRFNLD